MTGIGAATRAHREAARRSTRSDTVDATRNCRKCPDLGGKAVNPLVTTATAVPRSQESAVQRAGVHGPICLVSRRSYRSAQAGGPSARPGQVPVSRRHLRPCSMQRQASVNGAENGLNVAKRNSRIACTSEGSGSLASARRPRVKPIRPAREPTARHTAIRLDTPRHLRVPTCPWSSPAPPSTRSRCISRSTTG